MNLMTSSLDAPCERKRGRKMDDALFQFGAKVAVIFIPFLFALCFHEYAHGLVAKMRGDRTAELMGRLTMNPMAHADVVGTLVLPLLALAFPSPIFFGWAKPVPVNERNLKNPRVDMFWIAIAGPLSNVFLALMGALCIWVIINFTLGVPYVQNSLPIFAQFIRINLFLAIFNLLPIHPLDGGKVLARFLPAHLNDKLEENQMMLNFLLLFLVFSGALAILAWPVEFATQLLLSVAGGRLL